MDKVECYLCGTLICSGFISKYSDITCEGDDFEVPQHVFQTALNAIYPSCKDQLQQARRKIQGLIFRHPSPALEARYFDNLNDS